MEYAALSVHEVLSLQDPNFPDMHDWMTSSDNDECIIQIKDIRNASAEDSEISHEPLADHLLTSEPSHIDVSTGCSDDQPTSPKLTETISNDMDRDVASMAVDTSETIPNTSKRPRSDTIPPPKRIKSSEGVDDTIQTPETAAASKSWLGIDTSDSQANNITAQASTMPGFVGTSRSAIASHKLKQEFRDGTHVVNEAKRAHFVAECRLVDKLSQFWYEKDTWSVFHSKCGAWRVMAEPYSSTKFKQHVNSCKSTSKALGHTTLTSFFGAPSKARQKVPAKQGSKTNKSTNFLNEAPNVDCTCSGITAKLDARIPDFITCTGAEGGGARSVTKIADQLFEKKYADLSERKKTRVDEAQRHKWTFRFDRVLMAIFSTKCEKFVKGAKDSKNSHTCSQCLAVLRSDSRFKSGLHVPIPEDGNFRYLNGKYQGKSTAERYAKSQGLWDLLEDKVRHLRAALLTIAHS